MRFCPYLYSKHHLDHLRDFNLDFIDRFYVLNGEEIYYHPQALSPSVARIVVKDFVSII